LSSMRLLVIQGVLLLVFLRVLRFSSTPWMLRPTNAETISNSELWQRTTSWAATCRKPTAFKFMHLF
jgi:hypothetical protein